MDKRYAGEPPPGELSEILSILAKLPPERCEVIVDYAHSLEISQSPKEPFEPPAQADSK